MRKLAVILLLSLACSRVYVQNLVPNGGFEQNTGLPSTIGQWNLANGWSNVNGGGLWPYASPDYLHVNGSGAVQMPNTTFGTANPHTGNATMGIAVWVISVPDFREYISIQLSAPLVTGNSYLVSFYITNGQPSATTAGGYGIDKLGFHLSASPLSQISHEPIAVTPQYTIGTVTYNTTAWQQVSAVIVAQGPWQYLTIGNFHDDNSTTMQFFSYTQYPGAYYFIDDVSVESVTPSLLITGNTSICQGQQATLTAAGGTSYQWAESTAPATIISTASSITVSPPNTTTYLLYSGTGTASVTVNVIPNPNAAISGDTSFCDGDSVVLAADSVAGAIYNWSTGSQQQSITVSSGGSYWINVSVNGCASADTLSVAASPCAVVHIEFPNVFSPNGDGINDQFIPVGQEGISLISCVIYDRWGIKVFESEGSMLSWGGNNSGGKACPDGTYYFIAKTTDISGNKKEFRDHFLLTR